LTIYFRRYRFTFREGFVVQASSWWCWIRCKDSKVRDREDSSSCLETEWRKAQEQALAAPLIAGSVVYRYMST